MGIYIKRQRRNQATARCAQCKLISTNVVTTFADISLHWAHTRKYPVHGGECYNIYFDINFPLAHPIKYLHRVFIIKHMKQSVLSDLTAL